MKYKLFITDFDGTLGSLPDDVDSQTIEAVKKYIAKGGIFVICTGRMAGSVKYIYKKYNFGGLAIANQGAVIDDLDAGKRIFEGGLDYELSAKISKQMIDEGFPVCASFEEGIYCEQDTRYIEFYRKYEKIIKVKNLPEKLLELKKPVQKLVAIGEVQRIKQATQKYQAIYNGKAIFNNGADHLIEVINPNLDKGSAVRFLSKHFNIPYQEIITVGDSNNDMTLIKGEWHGVAVGNAKPELKSVAKEVTVDFNDKPIKYLLEKYCL